MTDFRSDGGNAPFLHAFTEREKATAASFHPIRRPFSAVSGHQLRRKLGRGETCTRMALPSQANATAQSCPDGLYIRPDTGELQLNEQLDGWEGIPFGPFDFQETIRQIGTTWAL